MKGNDGATHGWEPSACWWPRPGLEPVTRQPGSAELCQPQTAALTTEPRGRDDVHQILGRRAAWGGSWPLGLHTGGWGRGLACWAEVPQDTAVAHAVADTRTLSVGHCSPAALAENCSPQWAHTSRRSPLPNPQADRVGEGQRTRPSPPGKSEVKGRPPHNDFPGLMARRSANLAFFLF